MLLYFDWMPFNIDATSGCNQWFELSVRRNSGARTCPFKLLCQFTRVTFLPDRVVYHVCRYLVHSWSNIGSCLILPRSIFSQSGFYLDQCISSLFYIKAAFLENEKHYFLKLISPKAINQPSHVSKIY